MIIITNELLDEVTQKAKSSSRLRMNYNFHEELSDPVQRLLNALEPWTYIRPHKHQHKEESFTLLRGKILAVTFHDDGSIKDHCVLDAGKGNFGIEFEEDTFHMLTSLQSGSVVYEIKEGPFIPHSADNSAAWAPVEGSDEARAFLKSIFQTLSIDLPEED